MWSTQAVNDEIRKAAQEDAPTILEVRSAYLGSSGNPVNRGIELTPEAHCCDLVAFAVPARGESATDLGPGNRLDGAAIELRDASTDLVCHAASASSSTSVSRLSSNDPASAARASLGSAKAS